MTDDAPDAITWMSPHTQRLRPTEALSVAVAEAVLGGATVVAAAAMYGISKSKLMRWLDWGMNADADGAGPEANHAPYLDFFLKVLQAQGTASVQAQQQAFARNPQWWLQNHPETRAEYTGDTSGQLLLAAPTGSSVESAVVDTVPDEGTMRAVLRTLIDAGAAVAPDERLSVVDAQSGVAADIDELDDEDDRQVG